MTSLLTAPPKPKVSLVLLDWGVRESVHTLEYLRDQTVSRSSYEILWIEYFSKPSTAALNRRDLIDKWLVMGMPSDCYYHKHLMYNIGILLARGDIICICDSDAMVKPTFVESIIDAFEASDKIVLHLDQLRSFEKHRYPFNYPTFETIEREALNGFDGKPVGLSLLEDSIHAHNYGACFCAMRADLIAIGGADEHRDFLGHCCGPYDMTFRLENLGRRLVWHQTEWTYHTWHPGSAGDNNYVGPHDGKMMSLRALEVQKSGRIMPEIENEWIQQARTHPETVIDLTLDDIMRTVFQSERVKSWVIDLKKAASQTLAHGADDTIVVFSTKKGTFSNGEGAADKPSLFGSGWLRRIFDWANKVRAAPRLRRRAR